MASQTGIVFSQKRATAPAWPASGDVDDCWVVSGIQAANVIAPWLALVSVTAFRAAAGDPDDGVSDGGNPDDIYNGAVGCWPALRPYTSKLKGASWTSAKSKYDQGRPISLCVVASGLPVRLQYGFTGAHQVTIVLNSGQNRFANPLAPAQTRWDVLSATELAAVRDAALAYGKQRIGTSSIFAVAFPTQAEILPTHPLFVAAATKWASGELVSLKAEVARLTTALASATLEGRRAMLAEAVASVSALKA